MAAPVGTEIVAAGDGRAVVTQSPGYGNLVEIYHGDQVVTRYGHLDTFAIDNGARVIAGQPIGTVGITGNVPLGAQSHLHFEIVHGTTHIDPATIFNW